MPRRKDSRNQEDWWPKACADFGAYSRNQEDSWSKACAGFERIRVIKKIGGQKPVLASSGFA